MIKIYDPKQEKNRTLIKGAIAVAIGGFVGLILGRWWGRRSERKAQERQRRRMDWSDKKVKRRLHARDWNIANIKN
jgi:membrane protein DedA with SNARE-associated domain